MEIYYRLYIINIKKAYIVFISIIYAFFMPCLVEKLNFFEYLFSAYDKILKFANYIKMKYNVIVIVLYAQRRFNRCKNVKSVLINLNGEISLS